MTFKTRLENREQVFEILDASTFKDLLYKLTFQLNCNRAKFLRTYNWDSVLFDSALQLYIDTHSKSSLRDIEKDFGSFECNPFKIEFYTTRYWSIEEATQKISNIQKNNAAKSVEKRKDKKDLYPNQVGYWIKKGYSEQEAKLKVSQFQNNFSLEKCIQRYGQEEGLKRYTERQKQWINSLNQNSNRNCKFFSMECTNLFQPFLTILKDYTCFLATQNNYNEYFLFDKENIYFYDFTILELKLIFEYNGEAFHPNPNWSKEKWDNWKQPYSKKTAEEVHAAYLKKLKVAEDNGFKVIQIWSSMSREEQISLIQEVIKKEVNKN